MLARIVGGWIVLFVCGVSLADDLAWPQFLGPDRNGQSTETGLLDKLPAGGPKVLWRVPGGAGMAGVSVADGKAVTLVQRKGQQTLVALDAKSGKQLWATDLAPEYENQMGNGPRATPAIAGDAAYAFTGEGILCRIALADGEIDWQVDALADLGGEAADYGMACSPLVVGDVVIVTVGAAKGTVAAYDVKTGKRKWAAGEDRKAGYSSPALLTVGGRAQLVVFEGDAALGIDPATGKVLWRYAFETDFGCNIATPIAVDDQVFLSAGENHGSALISLKKSGDGFEPTETWTSFGASSVLRNEWQTSLLSDGKLFGFDNVGGAGPISHLTCVDAATGKRIWQKARFGKGNAILADGKLWIVTFDGKLALVKASAEKFEELGRASLLGQTRTAPSLAGGRLFARDDKEIVCVEVRK